MHHLTSVCDLTLWLKPKYFPLKLFDIVTASSNKIIEKKMSVKKLFGFTMDFMKKLGQSIGFTFF